MKECRARCRRRRCAAGACGARQPTSTRPLGVYLIALETRFCSNRRNRRRSDSTASEQGTNVQLQSPLLRERRELDLELAQQLVDAKAHDFRLHRAGIEPRNVEQRPEYFFDRIERSIDIADQLGVVAAALAARPGW